MEIDTTNVSSEPLFYTVPKQKPQATQGSSIQLLASTEEANHRLEICNDCEHYRKQFRQCKICNCIMPVKVRFKQVSCPDKRW